MAERMARYLGLRQPLGMERIAVERWSALEAVLVWSVCSALVWAAVIGFLL
jgi:hypothetical protein